MMRKIIWIPLLLIAIILSTLVVFVVLPILFNFETVFKPPTLEYPVQDPNNVTKLTGFNHPDWGGTGIYHNGIDLVCKNYTTIVAPVDGIVIGISEQINPYGLVVLAVIGLRNKA